MALYELSNYLLVCEKDPFTGFGGCGTELRLEQKRSMRDAADAAKDEGWKANPPGPWDHEQGHHDWFVLCPYCNNMREARLAKYQGQKGHKVTLHSGDPDTHPPIAEAVARLGETVTFTIPPAAGLGKPQ